MAKQQAIMRHKMDVIQGGGIPNDEHYLRILQFPDIMTEEGRAALRWENHLDLGQPTEVEMSIGDRIRNIAFHSVRSKGTRIRAIDTANVLNSEGRVEDVGMMDNDDDEDAAESMEDD